MGSAALQYEVIVDDLDAFEAFREQGDSGEQGTRSWTRELSELLTEPPAAEPLRIADGDGSSANQG